MKTDARKKFALAGGLLGAIYLTLNHALPTAPEFFLGLLLGLAMVSLVTGLLPDGAWRKVERRKRRGE